MRFRELRARVVGALFPLYSPRMTQRLQDKLALVTGGSRGIGAAIAEAFAQEGARVIIVARKAEELEATAKRINDKIGAARVVAKSAHTGRPDVIGELFAWIDKEHGALDIAVNNAATNPYFGPTLGVDEGRFDKTFGVNLRGPLFWCQAAWEQALNDKPGVIINIASVGGLRAEGGLGVYNLTKAALIHLTRQLAGELGPTRVVGIAPGLVQTDFAAFLVESFGDRLAAQLPLQRLGDPQDIANLAVFLASGAASWITGETYVIDGGAGVRSTS
jgi:NAD(P)-dependent dehydrogenase (short-subunit alcohol dehydrogenase family)